ncbi:hypothetical protein PTKU46_90430 [Paraburkholderia terrae]|uniref:endonuclease/exonuclease/phosphatase family protein n=1 Tax=Paraburkholderia terrae TaxID=311230 RepID=UPI0030E2BFE4
MPISFISWNINGAVFSGPSEQGGNSLAEGLEHVVSTLKSIAADVVALQELPCGPEDRDALDAALSRLDEYPYKVIQALSPSHVREGGHLGLGIFSRHPLENDELILLPTPGIQFVADDGSVAPLHVKGLLTATVATPLGRTNVLCAHLHPFKNQRRRPGEGIFDTVREKFRSAVERVADARLVLCADLNMDSLEEFLPGLSAQLGLTDLISVPTHWVRDVLVKADHILCSRHWAPTFARTLPTRFDHFLCYTKLAFSEEVSTTSAYLARSSIRKGFTVLHLSDLHYGTASQDDVDWKVWIDGAERTQRVERLSKYIDRLPASPDFLVVSGDITIAGDPAGLAAFEKALIRGIKDHKLPDARHIVIVPGNHDVNRKTLPRSSQRWDEFQRLFGSRFVTPWLPVHDTAERLLEHLRKEALESAQIIGGAHQMVDPLTGMNDTVPLPFTFDRKRKVLVYAFNSSLIAGSQLTAGAKLQKFLSSLAELGTSPPNQQELMDDLASLRRVDPARVEPTELQLFHGIVDILRTRLPDEYQNCCKIAVLHHHVVPFIPEEVKQFELMLNAGQFKKQLTDAGFQVVMHGHKHWPDMVVDSALAAGGELVVISGGTIGGGPSEGKPGFNWVQFEINDNIAYVSRYFIPVGADSVDDAIATGLAEPRQIRTLRLGGRRQSSRAEKSSFFTLAQLTERRLLDYLVPGRTEGPDGHAFAGWNNYLGDDSISVLGTAYTCLVLAAIGSHDYRYVTAQPAIVRYLLSMRRSNGLWSSTANMEPGQPLESCVVLSALLSLSYGDAVPLGRRLLQEVADNVWPMLYESTNSVTLLLQFAIRYFPDSPAVPKLLSTLCDAACRGAGDCVVGWGPSTGALFWRTSFSAGESLSTRLTPTAVHTALALSALASTKEWRNNTAAESKVRLDGAIKFLLDQPWHLSSETITESDGKALVFNYTTPVISAMALLQSGIDSQNERIRHTMRSIIDSQKDGLWDFGIIRRPSWCTLDNILALKLFSQTAEFNSL